MNKTYDGNYKVRENKKYEEFINELEEVKYPIYLISGSPYWKKFIIDKMSKSLGRRPDNVDENLKPHLDKMRYKSLNKKKHFILFQSKSKRLKESDFKILREYFAEPSENGVLVIQLKDWNDKKLFLNSFRMIRKSARIKMIELDYTSDTFKSFHIKNMMEGTNIKFENDKLKNKVIRNLSLNLEELEDNIMTLESFEGAEITENDYNTSIEKYSDNTMDKFYDSLTFANRKKVPYEILRELLDDGRQPNAILKGIYNHFTYLYQAKYLRVNGILRPHDIEDEKIKIYELNDIQFKSPNIWDISKKKRTKYLEDCEDITIKEIVKVLMLIEECYVVNRVDRNGSISYTKYTNKERLIKLVISIMNRREEE